MDRESFIQKLAGIVGKDKVRIQEPMKFHTSFKIGGPADFLVMPASSGQLRELIELGRSEEMPLFVMGNGTNLIVRDQGIRGLVVKITEAFGECRVEDETMEAEAGILLSRLSNIAWKNGLTGLEFASGIPGTLGGAVVMNAGAYGPEMKDVIVRTEFLGRDGEIRILQGEEHEFGYRMSHIQKVGGIVLRSVFRLKKGDSGEIKATMDELSRRRNSSQPLEMPSAGSIFKRPPGHYAGPMIEGCGLKGFSIGGAQVSVKHAGFIVNTGNATASDVIRLIGHIQNKVLDKYGVELHTEVKIVGEE